MKHVVQFSNGAGSAWVAWWVLQNMPKEDVILLNHDPGAEHADSKRFQEEVSKFLDHPITEKSCDKTLWELIEEQHCLPSSFIPWCTRMLKIEPGEEFLQSLDDDFIMYNGFGFNEWRRVQKATARTEHSGRKLRCPLFENKMTGDDAKKIIREEWKICLPEPYKFLSHNNCIPCFKAGKGHFIKVAKHYPAEFERACQAEEATGFTIFRDCTLRELEKQKVDHNQLELFDTVPCMCAN